MTDNDHSIELSVGEFRLAVTGSEEFVKEQFFTLYENHGVEELDYSDVKPASSRDDPGQSGDSDGGSGVKSKPPGKTINEYLAESGASTKQDNALVVGWYLEAVEGNDDFTAPEVKDKADSGKVPLGARVKRDLDKNVEKGYLHSPGQRDGKDTYWVTDTGEEYLDEIGIPAK